MRIKILMPGIITPSGNEFKRWLRVGLYWKFGQIKKDYHNILLLCDAHNEKYRVKNKDKRRVAFYSFRERLLDDDNLSEGFKYLRDKLIEFKLIYEDSPKYLDARYKQRQDKPLRTEITIEDLE